MDLPNRYHEERPWGSFDRFTLNEASTVKIIIVNPGEAFSLQRHRNRREFWRVLSGSGKVEVGETEKEAAPGDEFFVDTRQLHRATGGPDGLTLLEIALGEFDESDIERLEDKYGRSP